MLIAVSGSQGSGKSTVIDGLKDRGFNTIERKTSRSILDEWGVSLTYVNNNPNLTVDFQDEISIRKLQDEEDAIRSDDLWFTERTHADLFTYALVSLGKDNKHSKWLDRYYNHCMTLTKMYSHVFYLEAGHFDVEHDGTRGSGKHYSRMVDLVMLDTTFQMVQSDKLTVIDYPDLHKRLDSIIQQSTKYKVE